MTEDEVQIYVGKPVRVTLTDGRIVAGTLHAEDAHGHGHTHFVVASNPVQEGGQTVRVVIHGPQLITQVEDASDDPAAVE